MEEPLQRPWLGRLVAAEPELVSGLAPRSMVARFRLFTVLAAAFICVSYALLLNPYWHYTSDSALYLTLARNLHHQQGYVFAGAPHAKVPGGMPWFLAELLRVSHRFLWLNAVQTLVVLAGLAVFYLALRQMADAPTAALVTFLTGMLFWVHEYATALMSEGPFLLLSGATVLLLMLLTNSRQERYRALLLVGLCATWALAFWCRIIACFWIGPFVFALLFGSRVRHRLRDRALSAVVVGALIVLSFAVYWRWSAPSRVPARPVTTAQAHGGQRSFGYELRMLGWRPYAERTLQMPHWFLMILCPPWHALEGTRIPAPLAGGVAWACLGVVALGCWAAVQRGQALLAGSVLFVLPFFLWSSGARATTGRYVIAMAPFVILLFLMGMQWLGGLLSAHTPLRNGRALFVGLGIAAVFVPNLALLAGDIYVPRRPDF